MTIPNRRADAFDSALAAKQIPTDPAIAALVAVAGALAAVPQVPTPAFREGLRARLMSEATSLATAAGTAAAPVAAAPLAVSPLQALTKVLAKPAMQVATGGLAATIAVSGLGVGASRSEPGDSLYGLKRVFGGQATPPGATQGKVDEIVALLEREGAAATGAVEETLSELKSELDVLTADLLAQARAGSRAAYDRLRAEVATLTHLLQSLRGDLPPEAQQELDAAMATLNAARAQLNALPVPGVRPGVPKPTGGPRPSSEPTKRPGTKPSSPPPITPTTIPPSTPGLPQPTITAPPVSPAPTVPVSVPTLLP